MGDKFWAWIRVPLATLIVAMFSVFGVAGPASAHTAQAPLANGAQVVVDGVTWTYISAEQNALDQARERAQTRERGANFGKKSSPLYGCGVEAVCLYQWINYGGDRWQSSIYNLASSPNNCINLTSPMAYWDNGTKVTDNSGSMVINGWGFWPNSTIGFYNWVNCQYSSGPGAPGVASGYTSYQQQVEPNLSLVPIGNSGFTAYHTITSIKMLTVCPPGGC